VSNPWDIVILGCGQLGGNLKTALEAEKIHVLGVRRIPVPDDSTFISLDLDVADAWEQLAQVPLAPNAVIIAIMTPDARTEDAYRQRYVGVSERLRQFVSAPGREHVVIWVSSTAVFGQHQSGVLDESVPAEPDHWRGYCLREAEQNIEQIQAATVIRLTGLYNAQSLIRLQDPGFREQLDSKVVSNRIHREDAVSWLNALACNYLQKIPVPSLIHGVDMGSARYQEIYDFVDGVSSAIKPATVGRIVNSRYRDRMPALQYPTCEVVINSP
jgi:nucleoside-diphosphate-sugar epimerase